VKNPFEVLKTKEQEMAKVKNEIDALRVTCRRLKSGLALSHRDAVSGIHLFPHLYAIDTTQLVGSLSGARISEHARLDYDGLSLHSPGTGTI